MHEGVPRLIVFLVEVCAHKDHSCEGEEDRFHSEEFSARALGHLREAIREKTLGGDPFNSREGTRLLVGAVVGQGKRNHDDGKQGHVSQATLRSEGSA